MSSPHYSTLRCPLCEQRIPSNQDFLTHFQSHLTTLQQAWYRMRVTAEQVREISTTNESRVSQAPQLTGRSNGPSRNNNGGQRLQANHDEHDEQSTGRSNNHVSDLTDTGRNEVSSVVTRPFIDQLDIPIQQELNVDDENNELNLTLSL